jgi:2-polyprenyl-6-methoxyphenol hydroxylase-like FAD-dependent oxidoreductase
VADIDLGGVMEAVVLGGSIAGLYAARVLASSGRRVTLVERDPLPSGPADRKGVPQARHAHALISAGVRSIGEMFPGLLDRMAADGVPVTDSLSKFWFEVNGAPLNRSSEPLGSPGYTPSRSLLEARIRAEVVKMPHLRVRDNCTALAPVASADRRRVTGMRIATADGSEETLPADLVVDATGRGSRLPLWLRELGYDAPDEEEVPLDNAYATRRLRVRPGALGGLTVLSVTAVPGRLTGLTLLAQEDDHYVLTLGGYRDEHPPTDLDDFLAFADRMVPADVSVALRDAQWLGEPSRHRFPVARRRFYERLNRLPEGLLAIGDGVCSFNPVYGQGMTVAALEALALRDILAAGGEDLPRRFFAAAAVPVGRAWQLASGADRELLDLPRTSADRVAAAYLRRLNAAATHDATLTHRFLDVIGLTAPPAALFHPSVLLRVLAGSLRSRPTRPPAPSALSVRRS